MEIQFRIIGVLLVILALLHFIFPGYFNWKRELSSLSLVNRQMMIVHSFFIAGVIFLMGLLCLTSPHELSVTPLGRKIALGMGIFWTARLFVQFLVYSPKLWKGKLFETTVHVIFSLFWAYLSAVFILAYVADRR